MAAPSRHTDNGIGAACEYRVSKWKLMVVEWRVLGPRRFAKDTAYWAWVRLWFALPVNILWSLTHVPFMAGCRGYFEWRDDVEHPAIGRWNRLRWRHWQRSLP